MIHTAFHRGMLLFQQERYDQAVEEFMRVLAERPNHGDAHRMLALCHAARKRWREAEAALAEAMRVGPDDPWVHYTRAVILRDRGRYVHAGEAIREALRLDPHEADFWFVRACLCFETGQEAGAVAAAEQGLQIDPTHADCLRVRGRALARLGPEWRERAGESIRSALAENPASAEAHCDAGWTRLQQDRPREAFEHFRESLRLDPRGQHARQGLLASLRGQHPAYRLLLRFVMLTPTAEPLRWMLGPILALGGAAVLWKGVRISGPTEIVAGAIMLILGATLLLGQPLLDWLIDRKRR